MMMKTRKRIGAAFMAAALLIGQQGAAACAEGPPAVGGLCEHHTAHDAACGYVEAIPGGYCEHKHTTDCYSDELICGYEVDAEQTATDSDADHQHEQACYALDCPHERGEHGDGCGYIEAVPGTPCGYVCDLCGKEPDKDSGTTPVPEKEETIQPEGAVTITVTAFDGLADAVKYQTVEPGTKLDALTLPATLGASGYTVADDTEPTPEPITINGVTWEPDSPWDETAQQGVYTFTPVLPAGYALADHAKPPEIAVRIGGEAAALDLQGGVLTVEFNDNGNSDSKDNNNMKAAIDVALASGDMAAVTTIKLTGDVTEITDWNWRYLIGLYQNGNGWNGLTTLDLSEMTKLTAVRDDASGPRYVRQRLKTLTLPAALKEIGNYAFRDCLSLALQELPAGVTQIGDYAFVGCPSLALQELPAGVTQIGDSAFVSCPSLALQELPAGVTQIGDYAFYGCPSLALQKLPVGVTQIGNNAFYGCTNLKLTELPVGVTQIGSYAFYGCTGLDSLTIPASVENIGKNAFYGCTNLKKVTFEGKKAPTFGTRVFDGITPQPTVFVPEGATGYPDSLKPQTGVLTVEFNDNGNSDSYDNSNMEQAITTALAVLPPDSYKTVTTIKLTGSVTEITMWNWHYLINRFQETSGWNSLTTLDLSDLKNLKTIQGYDTISGDRRKLKTLNLPDSVTTIGNYAFWKCTNLDLQKLPVGVTEIGNTAFSECGSLALTKLPVGVTHIGNNAFSECWSLALTELPGGVTHIGGSAFIGCRSLALTELPVGVTQIGESAFSGCTGLNKIIMEPLNAPQLGGNNVFDRIDPPPTIYVPKGGQKYDSGGWEKLNTVKYSPTMAISLPATLALNPGQNEKLTYGLTPDDAVPIVLWESSAPGVATVDKNGNVTAIAEGTATITATSRQGRKTATCTVTVKTDTSGNGGGGGSNSGGGGSNSGGSGGSSRNYIITTPQPPKPNNPVLAVIELPVTVGNGTATGKPDDGRTASAIAEAQRNAKAKTNGIAVQYDAKTAAAYDGFSIAIKRATLDRLIAAKVKWLTVNTDIADLTFDLAALKEIAAKSTGDITLTAAREKNLTGDALAAVGSRPAYRLNMNYTGKDGKAATVQDFGAGRVTVGLAYKPAENEQTGSLFLVYSKDGGSAQWFTRSNYDRTSGNVLASTGHFSVYGVGYKPAPAFADTVNHWAKADIDFAASRGLLAGTGDATFSPETAVTQGQFSAALDKLAGRSPDEPANPNAAITREQMALIIKQYAAKWGYTLPVAREAETFADDSKIRNNTYRKAIQSMQQAGIMSGKGDRRFGPRDTATRAEAAAVLRRFVEIVIDPAAASGWSQNDAGRWLYYENNKPVTGWKQIDRTWYCFDAAGLMQTGGWREIGGKWYYFFPDGAMAVNTKIDGYEIGPDGARKE